MIGYIESSVHQVIGKAASSSWPLLENYPITNLPNYQIFLLRLGARSQQLAAPHPMSIVHIEIQQVPVNGEPGKADAGQHDQQIPHLGPEPQSAVSP
jgi:hypothetical protein